MPRAGCWVLGAGAGCRVRVRVLVPGGCRVLVPGFCFALDGVDSVLVASRLSVSPNS